MLSVPINMSLLKEILLVLFSTVSSIVAIIMFFQQKDKHDRRNGQEKAERTKRMVFMPLIVFCAIILIAYVLVSSYLVYVNRDRFSADLVINLEEPYMVNYNGTGTDDFIVDADYRVISMYRGFSVNAKIQLRNIQTGESYSFKTFNLGEGYRIADFPSGLYNITIETKEYELYSEYIKLDRSNIVYDDGGNTWFFTAYAFDKFNGDLVETVFYLGDNKNNVENYAFTISGGDVDEYLIFYSDIDWDDNGRIEGYFVGHPGTYEINNAISPTNMDPVIVIIPTE